MPIALAVRMLVRMYAGVTRAEIWASWRGVVVVLVRRRGMEEGGRREGRHHRKRKV